MSELTLENLLGRNGQKARRLTNGIFTNLNKSISPEEMIQNILLSIKDFSGIEAVAVRMQEGDDYPYYTFEGFPDSFVKHENYLCIREDSKAVLGEQDLPMLECMCGSVIRGNIDPSMPCFTDNGSFWTNSTTDLSAESTEEIRAGLRGYCNLAGYESVAIIPLKVDDEIIGTLQMNDHRRDMFSEDIIKFYEEISESVGIVVRRGRTEAELRESEDRFRVLYQNAPLGYQSLDVGGFFKKSMTPGVMLWVIQEMKSLAEISVISLLRKSWRNPTLIFRISGRPAK